MKKPAIGFIGFGEAASCFTKHFAKQGIESIYVYCSGNTNYPPYSEEFKRTVTEHGATLVNSMKELLEKVDVVFSAVLVANSLDVGLEIAQGIRPETLVVDINASTPSAKVKVADAVKAAGGQFVDSNLMGAVSIYGATVPLYSSGDGAERFDKLFKPMGLEIENAGPKAGAAAAVKMLRSVVTKGMEALIIEAMTAAALAGVRREAWKGICGPMDATVFSKFADMCIMTDVLHAERRAIEMDGAAETVRDLGLDPLMAEATAARLRASASLGLKSEFAKKEKYTVDDVLTAYANKAISRKS
jgi:3-hydroxyisobutyrate dehydrogenase-like beta-hydroxyacid dehydrogenase